ncbi:SDR family NAD(P)-dependent oxidoreductase [Patulibacter minatonensis]|uniref:SDR family NAD(P)-dependent oxidoreductase n=1 Tax=Patulibacter minatonensis TaxID=298163 RepID=UPI00047A400B|nr:SDR family NAD(P)-dependent oxidoreductase [Patulibacter minatonensis]
MTTILISGANKGLGRETARRLVELGHDVWVGARDPAAGRAAADELGARFVALDVTDDASVAAARATVADAGGLDVLVNNAGISATRRPVLDTDPAEMVDLLATNVIGPVRLTLAFRDLLDASPAPVVVNVSSSLASLSQTATDGSGQSAYDGLDYPTSKSALNMVTLKLARALPRYRVNAVCPGFTATALNDFEGHRTVEQGAEVIVRAATLGPDGPTGEYFDDQGAVAW